MQSEGKSENEKYLKDIDEKEHKFKDDSPQKKTNQPPPRPYISFAEIRKSFPQEQPKRSENKTTTNGPIFIPAGANFVHYLPKPGKGPRRKF